MDNETAAFNRLIGDATKVRGDTELWGMLEGTKTKAGIHGTDFTDTAIRRHTNERTREDEAHADVGLHTLTAITRETLSINMCERRGHRDSVW